jgi:hypothetical protein
VDNSTHKTKKKTEREKEESVRYNRRNELSKCIIKIIIKRTRREEKRSLKTRNEGGERVRKKKNWTKWGWTELK